MNDNKPQQEETMQGFEKYNLKRMSYLYKWVEISSALSVRLLSVTQTLNLHMEVKRRQADGDQFQIYEINRSLIELYSHLVELDCESIDWLVADLKPLTERKLDGSEESANLDDVGEQVYDILSELGRSVIDEYSDKLLEFYKSDVGKLQLQLEQLSRPVTPTTTTVTNSVSDSSSFVESTAVKKGWTNKLMRSLSSRSLVRPTSKVSITSSNQKNTSSIYSTTSQLELSDILLPKSPTLKAQNGEIGLRKTLLKVKAAEQNNVAQNSVVVNNPLPSPPFETVLVVKPLELDSIAPSTSPTLAPSPPLKHSNSLLTRLGSLRLTKKKVSPKLRNKEIYSTSLGIANSDEEFIATTQSQVTTPSSEITELNLTNTSTPNLSDTNPVTKPKLVRSKTLKERFIGRSNTIKSTKVKPIEHKVRTVDVNVLNGGLINGNLTLVVNSDISLDKLLKGIRSKATLYGHNLPNFNKLQLKFCGEDEQEVDEVDLTADNFNLLFKGDTVKVKVYLNKVCAHIADSDDDDDGNGLVVPKHRRNQLSRNLLGLDLNSSQINAKNDFDNPLYTTMLRNLEENKIDLEDYLKTPTRTELKYHMKNSVWDSTPQLHLNLGIESQQKYHSSTNNTSSETSPSNSPAFDKPPAPASNSNDKPISKLTRCQTLANQHNPRMDLKLQRQLSSPLMHYQNSNKNPSTDSTTLNNQSITSMVQDFKRELLARKHIKLTVRINQDFNIKLDLDIETCTYTSLINKSTTKFSNGGYPLAALHSMDLVFGANSKFTNISNTATDEGEDTIVIKDTKTLKQLLIHQVNLGFKQVTLLLVPKNVLENGPRMALRWDHPPNFKQVFQSKVQ